MLAGRLLAAPFVATAVALGACGGSSAQPMEPTTAPAKSAPATAPQPITARHHLATFRLAGGRAVELRLAPGAVVRADGRSVALTPIDFLVDPGYAAWELSAVGPGRTVLTGRSDGKPFRVTLVVPS
jgi:hypothetical protein